MNLPGFIAPYPNVPYHLKEFPDGYHPENAKELFNQRHSLLRNATDRIFGALKARFPILTTAPPYPLQTQVKLVVAACGIHNYIRREKPDDWLFKMYEQDSLLQVEESSPPSEMDQQMMHAENSTLDVPFDDEQLEYSLQLRDTIATEMWNDYINDISSL